MFSALDKDRYTLTILGEGPLMMSLSNSISRHDLEKQVTLAGFSNNPWQWYAGADVFLLFSRWEGMPNAALESLACGTPVIATYDSGGIKEVAECTPNGAVTLVKNSNEFIKAMKGINHRDDALIQESFLPRKYEISSVISILERMLEENSV